MNASLNEKLSGVKWGEYRYDDFFQSLPINIKLTKSDFTNAGATPVFSAESVNNGIAGYTDRTPDYIVDDDNPLYVVFGDHTRTFNIALNSFCVMDNVKVLRPIKKLGIGTLLYIISCWKKCIQDRGYSRHWSIAKAVSFKLPVEKGKPDFSFMESFVAELEEERIAELTDYLIVSGLDNCELSLEECESLETFAALHNDNWGEYRIGDLFDRVETNKLQYQAKELPDWPSDIYNLPCLTSSFQNQGLNYYAPKDGATILKNVISIPSNSDVYRAYFQSREFTVLSDAYAIRWKSRDREITQNQYLFMVVCINKITDLPIYSHKNKLGGWNIVKNKYIKLPKKDGKIDFTLMETFIATIKKLTIRDAVKYSKTKTNAAKKVVSSE